MLEKLKELALRYEDLQAQLADPSVYGDAERLKTVNRELKDLTPVAEAYQAYRQAEADRAAAEELLSDPEMRELAQEELTAAREEMERLRQELKLLLLPKDPNDRKNVILEIRAGTGGEEAALFAASLLRMYTMYAAARGWRTDTVELNETELGGVKECSVLIEGEGAWGFAVQFMQMWKMMGRTFANEDDFYRPRQQGPETQGFCQPFTDGPLNNPDNPIEATYLQLIDSAKRMLYIATPYYAVEESMQKALCIAADAGVDVRLVVPAIPDKKYVYMVAETYWGELLAHGVKIYRYTPGFVHAKSVMVDREVALVGSTNMDYRTFQLHYECAVLLYHMPAVEDLLEDMDRMVAQSAPYTLAEWNQRSWLRKMCASLLRLVAIWF